MELCFNNCNFYENGENSFYINMIKPFAKVIFDVGVGGDSIFDTFDGIVHYFEPRIESLDNLKKTLNNKESYLNNFGLGNSDTTIPFYKEYESFVNRSVSFPEGNSQIETLTIKTGFDYIRKNNIALIDFLKIDTEGYEFDVIKGFYSSISRIKCIQFEYGGTFKDSGIKLNDVIEYLEEHGFINFSYLHQNGLVKIEDRTDHYQYCNIVCFNRMIYT